MYEKEKNYHGSQPVQGSDTPSIAKQSYSGDIPPAVIERFEREIHGLEFGGVSLVVSVRDGRPSYRIEKVVSIMVESLA